MSATTSGPVRAIALRPRSTAAVILLSVVGIAAFGWPLLVDPGAGLAHGTDAPLLFAMLLPLLLAVVLAEVGEGGLDVKAVAMLGVLSAVGAALRPLGAGTAGLETVFFLVILAGRVFGAGFGFVLGATTLGTSALLTGGVGPWLPFQMLGAAWVGLGAGLLPRARGRSELGLLAAYGGLSALAYGLLLNLTFWPFSIGTGTQLSFVPGAALLTNLHHFLLFSVATSLGWDLGRALTNVVLILLAGRAVLGALRRTARRAAFTANPIFESTAPARPGAGGQPASGLVLPQCSHTETSGLHGLPGPHRVVETSMTSNPRFPRVVDDVSVRLIAAVVLVLAIAALALHQWWIYAVLAVDFTLRVVFGPKASPVAQGVQRLVRPQVSAAKRPTAGPPKRFAAGIGAVLTTAAAVLWALGVAAPVVVTIGAVMIVFPALESILGICVGCKAFAVLMKLGVVPEEICLECADISLRQRQSPTPA